VVVADLGGDTAFNVLDFFLTADSGIVMTTSEPAAYLEAYAFIKVALYRKLARMFGPESFYAGPGDPVLRRLIRKAGKPPKSSISESRYLYACDIQNIEDFIPVAHKAAGPAFSKQTLDYLIRHYGTEYKAVLDMAERPALSRPVNPHGEIMAQVLFAIRHEMARSLTDIFFRRTGMGWLGHPGDKVIEDTAAIAAQELGWSGEKMDNQIGMLNKRFVIP